MEGQLLSHNQISSGKDEEPVTDVLPLATELSVEAPAITDNIPGILRGRDTWWEDSWSSEEDDVSSCYSEIELLTENSPIFSKGTYSGSSNSDNNDRDRKVTPGYSNSNRFGVSEQVNSSDSECRLASKGGCQRHNEQLRKYDELEHLHKRTSYHCSKDFSVNITVASPAPGSRALSEYSKDDIPTMPSEPILAPQVSIAQDQIPELSLTPPTFKKKEPNISSASTHATYIYSSEGRDFETVRYLGEQQSPFFINPSTGTHPEPYLADSSGPEHFVTTITANEGPSTSHLQPLSRQTDLHSILSQPISSLSDRRKTKLAQSKFSTPFIIFNFQVFFFLLLLAQLTTIALPSIADGEWYSLTDRGLLKVTLFAMDLLVSIHLSAILQENSGSRLRMVCEPTLWSHKLSIAILSTFAWMVATKMRPDECLTALWEIGPLSCAFAGAIYHGTVQYLEIEGEDEFEVEAWV
jgi:hypothetical protein